MDTNKTEQAINSAVFNDIKQKMDMVHDSLVVQTANAKLPEDIFKHYFLPCLTGKAEVEKGSTLVAEWISIAGSPMGKVDIIDLAGNTLFTVPSLFDTNNVNVVNKGTDTLSSIYTQYELRNNNIPIVAAKYLKQALDDKTTKLLRSSPEAEATAKAWRDIYTRYGIISELSTDGTDESVDDAIDDLDYLNYD